MQKIINQIKEKADKLTMAINIVDVEFTRWISQSLNTPGVGSASMTTIGHDATQFGLLISSLFRQDVESSLVYTTNGKVWIEGDMEDQAAIDLWRILKIFLGITKSATYATPPWAVSIFTPCILAAVEWLIEDEVEASPLIYQSLARSLLARHSYIASVVSKLEAVSLNPKAIRAAGSKFGFEAETSESLGKCLGTLEREEFELRIKLINEKSESIEIQRAMLLGECMALESLKQKLLI